MKTIRRQVNVVLLFLCVGLVGCRGEGEGEKEMKVEGDRVVRRAMGAGRWFPDDGARLKQEVTGYMDQAKLPAVEGRIVSGLAPHAGYQYSGKIAGHTFRALRDAAAAGKGPETIVVIGFTHRQRFSGVALMDGDALATPIGEVVLDREAGRFLCKESERIRFDYAPHCGEHSAENEVPFAQVACPGVPLVIGLIGDHDVKTIDETVQALLALGRIKKIVVIASTDMLHDANYDLVSKVDKDTLKKVKAMDDRSLLAEWSGMKQTFCGICPVTVAMRYAEALGCKRGTVLAYRNSGDDYPESRGNWVVGYGAVVFCVPE